MVGRFRVRIETQLVSDARAATTGKWTFSAVVEGSPLSPHHVECVNDALPTGGSLAPPAPSGELTTFDGVYSTELTATLPE